MANKNNKIGGSGNLEKLIVTIQETNEYFLKQVQKQVNAAFTLRNWIIGFHIVEYEQHGKDRASYGVKVLETLAVRLKQKGLKGLSETNLKLFRLFYNAYPQIRQTVSDEFSKSLNISFTEIRQVASDKSLQEGKSKNSLDKNQLPAVQILNNLSFSHFIELLKIDEMLKRRFYEVQAIRNTWGVRELKRSINSMLYERTGLSTDKQAVLEKHYQETNLQPEDIFRNPYLLDFLGLEERSSYSETDLEEAIITHLQKFLLEMGRGFCFEARQKRITFDNTHYKIDLVFYHRILKCHILIDLKLGEFTHADAGQMNMYLNYYKDNEMQQSDNAPVGIILCAGKNETLVKYATSGLAQKVFVSKYLINLPSEAELKAIIEEEQLRIEK